MPGDALHRAEFEALRATIRERGSLRMGAIVLGIGAWGLAAAIVFVWGSGIAALIPLAILFATFEVNYYVHTGVERIGRYIQVFHEEPAGAKAWETTAMNLGGSSRALAHPLLTTAFHAATFTNFLGVAAADISPSLVILFPAHIAMTYRIVSAASASNRQREADLRRFRALASESGTSNKSGIDLQSLGS